MRKYYNGFLRGLTAAVWPVKAWAIGWEECVSSAVAIAIGFVGVLVMLRPGIAVISPAALAVLAAALAYGFAHALTKKLSGTDSPMAILFYTTAIQLPLALLPALHDWAWPSLAGTAVRAVCSPASRCNRNGALSAWLAEQTGDVESVLVPGAGHGDIEGPTRAAYRWACGDDPSQPAAGEVRSLVRRWVREGLSGP